MVTLMMLMKDVQVCSVLSGISTNLLLTRHIGYGQQMLVYRNCFTTHGGKVVYFRQLFIIVYILQLHFVTFI